MAVGGFKGGIEEAAGGVGMDGLWLLIVSAALKALAY
jgi:hypothetical protein